MSLRTRDRVCSRPASTKSTARMKVHTDNGFRSAPDEYYLNVDAEVGIAAKDRKVADVSSHPAPIVYGLSPEDRAAVETFYRAFAGRPELLNEALAEDWRDIPLAPGQSPGREGMKPLIEGFTAAFPDAEVTIHEIIGAPGRAGVRAQIAATHTSEWFGVPATGRRFVLALHEFHHIADGRLTHTWHLEDWFGWMNQVGAFPPSKETTS